MLQKNIGAAVEITGMVYPPNAFNALLSSLLTYTFLLGVLCALFGETLFNTINFEPGRRLAQLMKNNQGWVFTILLLCNWISSQLIMTGAFEVFYDDKLVFSKLQSGHLPQPFELLTLARSSPSQSLPDLNTLPINAY